MTYYQNAAGLPPQQTLAIGPLIVARTDLNCVELSTSITTATTTDLYTVPAGKIALIPIAYTNNIGLAANTTSFSAKISGVYYRITADNGNTSGAAQGRLMNYIFNAGETLAFVTSTTSQINVRASIVELPSSYPIFSARLLNFTGGGTADALYTVPANKKAYCWGLPPLSLFNPIINIAPGGNTGLTYFVYTVPNGGTPSFTVNLINLLSVPGATSVNQLALGSHLSTAGDRYMISSSSTNSGQMAWVNIIEMPNTLSIQNIVNFPKFQSLFPGAFGFNSTQLSGILSLTNISSATTTDLYTVPSNYKLLFKGIAIFGVTGTITYVLKVKIGGNYYIIDSPAGTAVAAGAAGSVNGTFVLEAGQSVSCTTTGSTIAGNVFVTGILVPDTIPIKSVYLSSFTGSGTADTIYTLPSGKNAMPTTIDFNAPFALLTCTFGVSNASGATRSYVLYSVLSGGSAGSSTRAGSANVSNNTSIAKQTGLQFSMNLITAGDTIQISSDSSASGQFAWINLIEVNA